MTNKSLKYITFIVVAVGVLLAVAALKDLSKDRSIYAQGEIVAVPSAICLPWPSSEDVKIISEYEVKVLR